MLYTPFDKRSKSLPFHGKVTGSNPVRSTHIKVYCSAPLNPVLVGSFSILLYDFKGVRGRWSVSAGCNPVASCLVGSNPTTPTKFMLCCQFHQSLS